MAWRSGTSRRPDGKQAGWPPDESDHVLPARASGPVPMLLSISFGFGAGGRTPAAGTVATPKKSEAAESRHLLRARPGGFDVIGETPSHGWGYATLNYTDIQPDRADRWTEGVIGLTLKPGQTYPAPEEWGTISAWAGASAGRLTTSKPMILVLPYTDSSKNDSSSRVSNLLNERFFLK